MNLRNYSARIRYRKRAKPYRKGRTAVWNVEYITVAAIDMLNALLLVRGEAMERWRRWEMTEIKELSTRESGRQPE